MDNFISFSILSGCDYCPTIPKVGSMTSLKLIKKYGTIDNIINNNKYNIPDNYIQNFNKAYHIFKSYYDCKIDKIFTSKINIDSLENYLINDINMNINKVKNSLKKIPIK